jgi:hypothetical protein
MMSFRTGGGNFTGVLFNANGICVATDATSAAMNGLTRYGCLALAATNGWTVLAV